MRKLIVLGVVLAGLAGVDVAAKGWAESKLADKARVEAGAGASAGADIDSFPFLGRLAVSGKAGDVTFTLHDVAAQQLHFTTVRLSFADVTLDKGRLFKGKAELKSIDKGTITVALSAEDLTKQLGVPVTIDDGKVSVTVGGRVVAANTSVTSEGSLRLQVASLPAFNVPIPRTRLISCPVARVEVDDGRLEASCDVEEIPPAFLRAASRVVNG